MVLRSGRDMISAIFAVFWDCVEGLLAGKLSKDMQVYPSYRLERGVDDVDSELAACSLTPTLPSLVGLGRHLAIDTPGGCDSSVQVVQASFRMAFGLAARLETHIHVQS